MQALRTTQLTGLFRFRSTGSDRQYLQMLILDFMSLTLSSIKMDAFSAINTHLVQRLIFLFRFIYHVIHCLGKFSISSKGERMRGQDIIRNQNVFAVFQHQSLERFRPNPSIIFLQSLSVYSFSLSKAFFANSSVMIEPLRSLYKFIDLPLCH